MDLKEIFRNNMDSIHEVHSTGLWLILANTDKTSISRHSWEFSWVAERLIGYQEEFFSMKLIDWLTG